MTSRIARKIAQTYIEQNFTQPLRLQPDYNERNAQDFLGERSVVMNTGYGDRIHPGPGNAFEDEIVASDFESNETEGFEIIDDLDRMGDFLSDDLDDLDDEIIDDLDRMGDFWKESRLPSHKHNDKETVEKAWEKHKENNPDMEKYEGAMTPNGLDESKVEENSNKSADDEIIDDMGLGRMAGGQQIGSGSNGYIAMWNREKVEVYADSKFEAQEMAQAHFQKSTRKRIKGYDVTVMLAEKGGSQVTHRPMFASEDEIIDDMGLGRDRKRQRAMRGRR
jgi:hypothetical protein